MTKHYVNLPVTGAELEALSALAVAEEAGFFSRNPHLVAAYRDRLLAVALCQGAALQYLGRGYGVNDFDLHFFYAQNPEKQRLSRAVKRIWATVGSFRNVPVDFIRTVVPNRAGSDPKSAPEHIQQFLHARSTANAAHLSEKAVVGLLPRELFGATIWPAV
jgi:hypothetical protein